ncbi:MAG: methionine aminotransferase [Halieaceae bacterium]|jgi:methionine aminotransferase|nr:methionine aminotransferase [Halieaceae bacterium]
MNSAIETRSKLPDVGTTIFTVMSALARECDAINLSQGFPDYDGPQALREALARHTLGGDNQYAPMAGVMALREQIAAKLARYYQIEACPDTEITVVPGATEAIYCAITACLHPGDEAILLDPAYDSYQPAVALSGGVARRVPLVEPDFSVDWQAVEDAIGPRTRLIIINSPHNPTGAMLGDSDMQRLQALASQHDLWVISDEVYEHLVFDGQPHCSVLKYPGLRERSFATFSFGKTFHITGWKTGYCVAPPALTRELRKVHQFVAFVAVTPVQLALADFMAAEPDFPASLGPFYQAKRDRFCRALADSRFALTPSAGSYFQLLDYSAISAEHDTALAERLTREVGVASIPVSVFSEAPLRGRYLRFCFAKTDEVLDRAGEILCRI